MIPLILIIHRLQDYMVNTYLNHSTVFYCDYNTHRPCVRFGLCLALGLAICNLTGNIATEYNSTCSTCNLHGLLTTLSGVCIEGYSNYLLKICVLEEKKPKPCKIAV